MRVRRSIVHFLLPTKEIACGQRRMQGKQASANMEDVTCVSCIHATITRIRQSRGSGLDAQLPPTP
jgi:hypothetical protein